MRRSVEALPPNIVPIAADLLSGAGFAELPAGIDTLIYAPTPAARTEEAYRAIDWRVIFVVAGMLPLALGGGPGAEEGVR